MPGRRVPTSLFALAAVAGLVAAVAVLLPVDPVRAAPVDPPAADPPAAGVHVGGVGTASGTPDVLRVTIGAEVTEETVDAAVSGADAAAREVLAAAREAGVAERDVRTVNVAVHPHYSPEGEQITGYVARHDLEVTLRDVAGAGAVIGRLVGAAGDAARLQGVAYALEDDAAVQEEARAAAFADARRRAEQYAALVGRELGEVVAVRENVSAPPPGPYPAADAMAGGAESLALELAPGSTTVTVTAEVSWSLR